MPTAFVKAAPDRRVLNPQRDYREFLPEGESVTLTRDIRKWIADGDLIEIKPEPSTAAPVKTARAKPE